MTKATEILFYDAEGKLLFTRARANCKRFSMQAHYDHKTMNTAKANLPAVHKAVIPGMEDVPFFYKNGQSYSTIFTNGKEQV